MIVNKWLTAMSVILFFLIAANSGRDGKGPQGHECSECRSAAEPWTARCACGAAAQRDNDNYYLTDHLGSPRVVLQTAKATTTATATLETANLAVEQSKFFAIRKRQACVCRDLRSNQWHERRV